MDISNLLQNIRLTNKSTAVLDNLQTLPKVSPENMQKAFVEGEVIKGEVVDLKGLVAEILTESGDKVRGHLQTLGQLNIGDERSFTVKNENGLMKFLLMDEDMQVVADKSLKNELQNLGLKGTDENLETAKTLMKNELPVNKETFANLSRALTLLAKDDKSLDKALYLLKNEIPVNKGNAKLLDNFISKEINMLKNSTEIEDGINNLKDASLKNALIAIFNEEETEVQQTPKGDFANAQDLPDELEGQKATNNKAVQSEELAKNNTLLKDSATGEAEKTGNKGVSPELVKEASKESKDITKEPLNNAFKDIFDDIDSDGKTIDKTKLDKEPFTKEVIKDKLQFDLKADNKDEIDNFLNKTNEKLDKAMKLLENNGSEESKKLMQTLQGYKESVDFMNHTKNNIYLQMPLNINDNKTNGELLVFKDKKKKGNSGSGVSAIIGLDTVNLGRYETYIHKKDNKINFQFRLESEDIINLTKKNFDKLTELLDKYNLVIESASYKTITESFNIATKEDEFIEKSENNTLPNYNFNVKL